MAENRLVRSELTTVAHTLIKSDVGTLYKYHVEETHNFKTRQNILRQKANLTNDGRLFQTDTAATVFPVNNTMHKCNYAWCCSTFQTTAYITQLSDDN